MIIDFCTFRMSLCLLMGGQQLLFLLMWAPEATGSCHTVEGALGLSKDWCLRLGATTFPSSYPTGTALNSSEFCFLIYES